MVITEVAYRPLMNILPIAYSGCYLVEPLEDKAQIQLTSEKKDRILKGKILSVGTSLKTDYGTYIEPECKAGTTLYFLSYEGGYDFTMINNRKYYFVKFQDARGFEE